MYILDVAYSKPYSLSGNAICIRTITRTTKQVNVIYVQCPGVHVSHQLHVVNFILHVPAGIQIENGNYQRERYLQVHIVYSLNAVHVQY